MSAKQEQTLALLCAELQHGPVPVTVLLEKAIALGLNREYLKNAKRALAISHAGVGSHVTATILVHPKHQLKGGKRK